MTRMFAPSEGPRVFALAPGVDFSRALVAGLDARLAGQPPEAIARVSIWVNTRRAARALAALYAEGPARLLPRIRVVTEIASDPLGPLDLAPPVPALRRKLELARLVARLAAVEPMLAAGTAVFDLADSLAELLDEMQGEGVSPAALAAVDAAEHAAHWQRSLRFLELIGAYVDAGGARRRAGADAGGGGGAGGGLGRGAAGRSGDRRGLDRVARGDAGVHGGGGAAAAGGAGAAGLRRLAGDGLGAARGRRGGGGGPSAARVPGAGGCDRLRSGRGAGVACGGAAGRRRAMRWCRWRSGRRR